jgi:hypothetical protein
MPQTDDPFAEWNRMSGAMYDQWEKGMTAWWDQVLENPQFLKAMGENLSARARGEKMYQQAVDEGLERAHLPSRTDLVRVARIATLLEEKVLRVEDAVLQMKDQLDRIEREALLARVEAAEARVALQERLAGLEGRLAAGSVASLTSDPPDESASSDGVSPPSKPSAPSSRRRGQP